MDIEIYSQFIKICGTIGDPFRQYLRKRGLSNFIIDEFHITSVKQEIDIQLKEIFNVNEFTILKEKLVYLLMDNDPSGQKAKKRISADLVGVAKNVIPYNITKNVKDISELIK